MARTDTGRTEQQSQVTQGSQGNPSSQGSQTQARQMTQRQQAGVTAGAGFGPLALPLFAGDLFRMNPFTLMRRMTEEMDRVFGQPNSGQQSSGPAAWAPNIDVRQQDGNYVVRADLPGINPDDVTVEVTDAGLMIEGERKRQREDDQGGVHGRRSNTATSRASFLCLTAPMSTRRTPALKMEFLKSSFP